MALSGMERIVKRESGVVRQQLNILFRSLKRARPESWSGLAGHYGETGHHYIGMLLFGNRYGHV
jgi:hypothetical protein